MVTIKILGVQDPAVYAYVSEKYNILQNFPDKNVKIEFHIVSWEMYFDVMLSSFHGKEEYDIVMVAGHLWLRDFIEKDYLEELKYNFDDILPNIAKEMMWNNKTYLSPSFCDGHMVVYRKSVLQKILGKLPDTVITTEKLIEIAYQLKQSGYEYPIALKAHHSEIFLDVLSYMRTEETDIYHIVDNQVVCDTDRMIEGLKHYLKMREVAVTDSYQYGNQEIKEAFIKKEIVMAVTWSGQLGELVNEDKDKDDIGFMTLKTAWNVTWSFGINKQSKQKEICNQVLEYFRTKEVDWIVGTHCGAPIRMSSYLRGSKAYEWYLIQLDMIEKYSKRLLSIPKGCEKNAILYEIIHKIFLGKEEIERGIIDIKEKVESLEV